MDIGNITKIKTNFMKSVGQINILALIAVIACMKAILLWLIFPRLAELGWVLPPISRLVDHYHLIAENLIAGNGYRVTPDTAETMVRGPGYVFFLAIIFQIFGKSILAIQISNFILILCTTYFLYLLANNILNNSRLALVSSMIFAFHPGVIVLESRAGFENLFVLLLTLFLLVLYLSIKRNNLKLYFITGMIFGAILLTRGTPTIFIGLLTIYLLFSKKYSASYTKILKNIIIMVLGVFLVISPWMMRNYTLSGIPTIRENILGVAAFQGYYMTKTMEEDTPYSTRLQDAARQQSKIASNAGIRYKDTGYTDLFFTIEDEIEYERLLVHYTIDEYRKDPLLFIKHASYNTVRFWFKGARNTISLLGMIVTTPILLFTLIGIYTGIKKRLWIGPILLLIPSIYLIHIPLIAHARYYIPLMPILAILVTIGLTNNSFFTRYFNPPVLPDAPRINKKGTDLFR